MSLILMYYTIKFLYIFQKDLRVEMKSLYWNSNNVDLIDLKNSDFNKVRLNRNNLYYDFLLKICEFINKNTVLNE